MKLFSLLFAALVGVTVLTPATASAQSRGQGTRVTYDRCGNAIFQVYTFVGRDCHGHPIYRWVVQSRGHGGYNHGGHGGYSQGGHGGYSQGGHGGYSQGGHGGYSQGGRGGYSHGRSGISFSWSR